MSALNNQSVRRERRGSVSGVTIGGLRSSNGIVIKPAEDTDGENTDASQPQTSPRQTNTVPAPNVADTAQTTSSAVPPNALETDEAATDGDNTDATQPQTSPRDLGTTTAADKRVSTRFLASRPSIGSRNVALVRQVSNRSMTVSDPLKLDPAPMAHSPISSVHPDGPRVTAETGDVTRESFAGDLLNKFEQLNITFKVPSVGDQLRLPVSRNETVESVKVALYQEIIKKHKLLGTENEYVLRAEDDDYWTDESLTL